MAKDNYPSSGIGFFGLLTIVFIVLKLTKIIDWSWWWVLLFVWLPFAIIVGTILSYFLYKLIAGGKK